MVVDDDDAREILHHYRMSDVAIEEGDINADGVVNLGDIRALRGSDTNFPTSLSRISAPTAGGGDGVATDALVAHYGFDVGAEDTTGNGLDGVVHGAVSVEGRDGGSDSAFHFVGDSTTRIVVANHAYLQSASVTIGAWVKPDTVDWSGGFDTIVSKSSKGYYGYAMGCMADDVGTEVSSSPYEWAMTRGEIVADQWQYVAMTYDSELSRLTQYWYVGGELHATQIQAQMDAPLAGDLMIGYGYNTMGSWGTRGFRGAIDDVSIFDRALTQEEIEALASG
jgi:hypothetical protein